LLLFVRTTAISVNSRITAFYVVLIYIFETIKEKVMYLLNFLK